MSSSFVIIFLRTFSRSFFRRRRNFGEAALVWRGAVVRGPVGVSVCRTMCERCSVRAGGLQRGRASSAAHTSRAGGRQRSALGAQGQARARGGARGRRHALLRRRRAKPGPAAHHRGPQPAPRSSQHRLLGASPPTPTPAPTPTTSQRLANDSTTDASSLTTRHDSWHRKKMEY